MKVNRLATEQLTGYLLQVALFQWSVGSHLPAWQKPYSSKSLLRLKKKHSTSSFDTLKTRTFSFRKSAPPVITSARRAKDSSLASLAKDIILCKVVTRALRSAFSNSDSTPVTRSVQWIIADYLDAHCSSCTFGCTGLIDMGFPPPLGWPPSCPVGRVYIVIRSFAPVLCPLEMDSPFASSAECAIHRH